MTVVVPYETKKKIQINLMPIIFHTRILSYSIIHVTRVITTPDYELNMNESEIAIHTSEYTHWKNYESSALLMNCLNYIPTGIVLSILNCNIRYTSTDWHYNENWFIVTCMKTETSLFVNGAEYIYNKSRTRIERNFIVIIYFTVVKYCKRGQ